MTKRCRSHEAGSVEARSSISKSNFFVNRVVKGDRSSQPGRPRSLDQSPRSIEPARASQVARPVAQVDRTSQGEPGRSARRSSRSS